MTQNSVDFNRVVAPFTREDFFGNYWNRSFLHLKGTPGRFADVFTWDELNALLEQQRLIPPLLKLVQDGNQVDTSRYTSLGWGNVSRIDVGRLIACLAAGATLVVASAEDLSPRIRALSDSFRNSLFARNYVNLYAGWYTQKGLDLHWDSQDIMILQLSGRKRWRVFAPTRDCPLQGDVETPPTPTGPPAWEGELQDGDALYLPRGWWHVAFPVNEPSLHLTFGTVPPTGLEYLNWVAARLRSDLTVRRDLPLPEQPDAQAKRAAELRALMQGAIDENSMAEFLREWEAEGRARPAASLPQAPYEQCAPLEDASRIRLASSHRLAFSPRGEFVEFKAYGVQYGVPNYLVPALECLREHESLSVGELSALLDNPAHAATLRKSLSVLAQAGVILVAKA